MIEIKGLSKSLEGRGVLKDITISVPDRQIVSIVGASGTGKSVLMKHIVGLFEPDAGDVLVGGISVAHARAAELAEVRRTMGYVFQEGALLDSLSVRENLRLALPDSLAHTLEERAREALALVNLGSEVLDRYPTELSGGMRKRVGVARGIINRPEVVLYDEPTTGLDPHNVLVIGEVIRRTRDALNATCLVVTHDMGTVQRVSDRVLLLADGSIAFDGSPTDFFTSSNPAVRALLGTPA